ncbi:Transposon TX1 uncharacterized 82 kDa protein ORF 1 [Takifugu flavidus]|uniref:Transposon TX1 uncharacterized 82 kDa protein ORF 1 n=1 Tax=Takifugu flavidus TaxID=433684 RepID=A0A5C6PGB4_9TELE|nr:Transposon TX1 uncharacterized 82 kDa protein ORF 1 [Takifugu flavidus]
MAANAGLTGLSRKHGVKVGAGSVLSVEEVALAVGQKIGHSSIKSAARMNRAVVLFLAKVEQVNMLVETGITVGGQFVQVTPLTQPAARITLSNVPPFISDEFLVRELSRHGKVVSPIRKMLSGCKSPLLRHVVSHRRQVHMILNNRAEEFNYRFIVRVDDFDYTLFATSSALKCFNCNEEGHLARACPSRVASDAQAAEPAATAPVAPPAPRPVPPARRRWLSAEGSSAAPDGATAESQMEEKRDECVRESEVSGESEIVEMVVEMNGETGDRIQTGEQGTVGQVMGGLDGPGIVAGERGEGEVSTGERGEGEVSTGERGEGAVSTGERGEGGVSTGEWGEGGVSTGERGEEAVSAGEGTSGASEWWLVPARKRNKQKSAMKDKGGKTGRLEETVADTDTSDCESMSDGSELSGTTPDGQDFDLYPPGLFKKFLTQTKGMKGLDLGTYFPDRLCFIRLASFLIRNKATSGLTDPEMYRLRKHMGKARKQLN